MWGVFLQKEINTSNKLVGLKQTKKGLQESRVAKVYIAEDADPRLLEPVIALCREKNVPIEMVESMRQLGKAAGIAVGSAVVSILKE